MSRLMFAYGNRSGARRRMFAPAARRIGPVRRGVSSVLAMMFMVIFSSLTAVMAIVAEGNLRTAHSGLQLSRAMSAAETGLVFAQRRLAVEGSRFVVEKGVIDADFGDALWMGTYDTGQDGAVDVLPPQGYTETIPATSLAQAIRNAHLADSHDMIVDEALDTSLPEIDQYGTIRCRPIRLQDGDDNLYFRLKYQIIPGDDSGPPVVLVTSQGVDGDIARTLQLGLRITKRINFAILSPNRIMIGKNVRVEGPLGSRYGIVAGELQGAHGHPLVMRSDFYYLNSALDTKLDLFFSQVVEHDVDGDARLRPGHPLESVAISEHPELVDVNGDEYIDDFDLFLETIDADSDGRVVYDAALAASVGLSGMSDEFSGVDDQMARLIDEFNPDRNGDGVVDDADRRLGYKDGVLDGNDVYAKVHGRLAFSVARNDWESAHSLTSYQSLVSGPVQPEPDVAAAAFEVPDEEMCELSTSMFTSTQTWAHTIVDTSTPFANQVATAVASGGVYTAPSDTTWESVPFGAEAGIYDYYQRPVYENMTFTNVMIPKATNALFRNCTFVGVTYVQTQENCVDVNWNYAGSLDYVQLAPGSWGYVPKFPGLASAIGATPVADTRLESNNIRFDGCTFLGSIHGDRPLEYTHWRNKLQLTGPTRFYIDPADADLATQPDASTLISILNGMSEETREELTKSSVLMPGWSIDVGNFTNEVALNPTDTPKVKLKGTVIAGILDVRGTADVFGTLLMTFRPVGGQGPQFYGGTPDSFNTTIGYFGPSDGDGEGIDPDDASFEGFGEITLRYNPDAKLPDGIPWPITIEPQVNSYTEGGVM